MQTAIYIKDGMTQLVLTPDTEWETTALKGLTAGCFNVMRGSFYTCQGGWDRMKTGDDSVIIRILNAPKSE